MANGELRNLLDPGVMDEMGRAERDLLRLHFAEGTFRSFAEKQRNAIQREIGELNPFQDKDAVDFHARAKHLRLVYQFWGDFLAFAEEQGKLVEI